MAATAGGRRRLLRDALLLADEPTSRLDLVTQEETVRCLLEQLAEGACARVLVTHDGALTDAVCDRRRRIGGVPSVSLQTLPAAAGARRAAG